MLADLLLPGQAVSIIAVHPSNAVGKVYVEERNRQLDAIADYVAQIDRSVILAGDMNTTMWSPYYKRSLGKTQLYNTRAGFGVIPTWPAFFPLLSIPIDHCLVSQNIKVLDINTSYLAGSDHFALTVDLLIPSNKS